MSRPTQRITHQLCSQRLALFAFAPRFDTLLRGHGDVVQIERGFVLDAAVPCERDCGYDGGCEFQRTQDGDDAGVRGISGENGLDAFEEGGEGGGVHAEGCTERFVRPGFVARSFTLGGGD